MTDLESRLLRQWYLATEKSESARAGESTALEEVARLQGQVLQLESLVGELWAAMVGVEIGEHGIPLTECFSANTDLRQRFRAAALGLE